MKKKVIISDYLHPFLENELRKMDFDVDVRPEINNAGLMEIIADYDGLVHSTKTIVNAEMIDRGKKLKFIARAGSGLDNIDVDYAAKKNIAVLSAPEANANAVAEHALGMLLSLLNNIGKADKELRNGTWQREANRGYELDGKKVGIIGYGYNGSAFASKLKGFDVDILAHDKYKSGFGAGRVVESSLEKIYEEAEVISLHIPLTAETHHYVNSKFIDSVKNPFWLINTSRGKVVNTADLINGIESEKIRGAGLDVFENENFSTHSEMEKSAMNRLFSMPNTILTPHVAGWTFESFSRISKILAKKIGDLYL